MIERIQGVNRSGRSLVRTLAVVAAFSGGAGAAGSFAKILAYTPAYESSDCGVGGGIGSRFVESVITDTGTEPEFVDFPPEADQQTLCDNFNGQFENDAIVFLASVALVSGGGLVLTSKHNKLSA